MKTRVIPTVFATNYPDFTKRFDLVTSITKYIHVDLMDGQFVEGKSISLEDVPELTDYDALFEAHIMVLEPRDYFPRIKSKGFMRVIFHIEAHRDENDVQKSILLARSMKLSPMIALKAETPLEEIFPFIKLVDGILFMGVNPGAEKQPFISSDFEKIKQVRKFDNKVWIQVDGGITPTVAKHLAEVGVNAVNSGSYVSSSQSPKRALEQLEQAMQV
jgi:ribulose-phosphate 3-epimerase